MKTCSLSLSENYNFCVSETKTVRVISAGLGKIASSGGKINRVRNYRMEKKWYIVAEVNRDYEI